MYLPDWTTSVSKSSKLSWLISRASTLDATERYDTSDLAGVVGVGAGREDLVLEVGVVGAGVGVEGFATEA